MEKQRIPVHPDLREHSQIYSTPRVHKVTDNVYVAVGFALANMIMIEGKDGIIIVDTTEAQEPALEILKEFRKITSKPIKAIVLTHFHADHTSGASALLKTCEDEGKDVKIFAHSTLHSERLKSLMLSESISFGSQRQFGFYLRKGERQCCGIGPIYYRSSNIGKEVMPTDTFDAELDTNIAGVQLKLLHTPGETDDQISVWIPEWKVLMPADNIYEAFPNLYAVRGSPPRNLEHWYKSLDKVRYLIPHHLVPSHTNPVSGEKEVFDIVTRYRDAIQFVNDQTIRLLNKGFEPDEIVKKVRLPQRLASHPYLQEFYGTVSWSVRGVISGKLGWFDGNPSNIFPLSQEEITEMYQEMCGKENNQPSIENLLNVAQQYLSQASKMDPNDSEASRKIRCSLDLAQKASRLAEPQTDIHKKALSLTLSCFQLLAASCRNPNARNYFLAGEMELLNKGFVQKMSRKVLISRLKTWPISFVMEKLRFIFKAENCNEHDLMTVIFDFPDVKQQHSYTMRHCILEYHNDSEQKLIPNDFDVKVTCNSDVWRDVLSNSRPLELSSKGAHKIEGNQLALTKFMRLLDVGQSSQASLKHAL